MVRLGKERKKNKTFFYKERKRTERTERSFIKNAKECKEQNVLLKRKDAQPCFFLQIIMEESPIILTEEDIEIRTPSLSDCNEEEHHKR